MRFSTVYMYIQAFLARLRTHVVGLRVFCSITVAEENFFEQVGFICNTGKTITKSREGSDVIFYSSLHVRNVVNSSKTATNASSSHDVTHAAPLFSLPRARAHV